VCPSRHDLDLPPAYDVRPSRCHAQGRVSEHFQVAISNPASTHPGPRCAGAADSRPAAARHSGMGARPSVMDAHVVRLPCADGHPPPSLPRAPTYLAVTACASPLAMKLTCVRSATTRWPSWTCTSAQLASNWGNGRLRLWPPPPLHTPASASTSCAMTRRDAYWRQPWMSHSRTHTCGRFCSTRRRQTRSGGTRREAAGVQ
jgi:hypothetical protein